MRALKEFWRNGNVERLGEILQQLNVPSTEKFIADLENQVFLEYSGRLVFGESDLANGFRAPAIFPEEDPITAVQITGPINASLEKVHVVRSRGPFVQFYLKDKGIFTLELAPHLILESEDYQAMEDGLESYLSIKNAPKESQTKTLRQIYKNGDISLKIDVSKGYGMSKIRPEEKKFYQEKAIKEYLNLLKMVRSEGDNVMLEGCDRVELRNIEFNPWFFPIDAPITKLEIRGGGLADFHMRYPSNPIPHALFKLEKTEFYVSLFPYGMEERGVNYNNIKAALGLAHQEKFESLPYRKKLLASNNSL